MRRNLTFLAIVLIAVGTLLLLDQFGVLAGLGVRVWALIGPLLLVAFGLWILVETLRKRPSVEAEETAIPFDDARRAHIRLQHGAGRLYVGAGAEPGKLVSGSFVGGLDYRTRREGDLVRVDLSLPSSAWPVVVPVPWQNGLE